jgi:hypothetical protein
MKCRLVRSLFAIAFCMPQILFAQSVERPRPAGWDRIVPGGRFMDRFEESQPIGPLTSECWGGDNVKPRDVRNGMEEPDYKALGREKSGRLFFATCRVDGTKLAGDCR